MILIVDPEKIKGETASTSPLWMPPFNYIVNGIVKYVIFSRKLFKKNYIIFYHEFTSKNKNNRFSSI